MVKHAGNGSGEVELHQCFHFATFDIIGGLLFGEFFHSLENSEHHLWKETIVKGAKVCVQLSVVQHLGRIDYLVRWSLPKAVIRMSAEHYNGSREKVDSRIARGFGLEDMMSHIMRGNFDKDKPVTREATDSNAVIASSETAVITLDSTT